MKLSEAITKFGDVTLYEASVLEAEPAMIAPKKIDMTACIESGIDCEFSDDGCYVMPTIDKVTCPEDIDADADYVRPRMNGHPHASPTGWDKCPLPEGFKIAVWDSRGSATNWLTNDCSLLVWENVRMFQVTGIAEGYEL